MLNFHNRQDLQNEETEVQRGKVCQEYAAVNVELRFSSV